MALNKRAFVVLGPESSGTRLTTQLLIDAGCYGDATHIQRLDLQGAPAWAWSVVWRRSAPFCRSWPDLSALVNHVGALGYQVTAVVTVRDWYAMVQSQIRAGHVADEAQALAHIQRAYRLIFNSIAGVPFVTCVYESLVQRPKAATKALLNTLRLLPVVSTTIYDGNARYYEVEHES